MRTKTSDEYISNRAWLREAVGGKPLILRGTSALEFLEMIDGYFGEEEITVYSNARGEFENINYKVVDNFESIDYISCGNVLCSTFCQAINDMLSDFSSDDGVICEALCNYYYTNNNSFDSLKINPENKSRFISLKESAICYFNTN